MFTQKLRIRRQAQTCVSLDRRGVFPVAPLSSLSGEGRLGGTWGIAPTTSPAFVASTAKNWGIMSNHSRNSVGTRLTTIWSKLEMKMLAGKQPRSSRWPSSTAYLAIVALLATWSASICALAQEQRLSQYAHGAWVVRDGFFNSVPMAITLHLDRDQFRSLSLRWLPLRAVVLAGRQETSVEPDFGALRRPRWQPMDRHDAWGALHISSITSCSCIPIFMTTWASVGAPHALADGAGLSVRSHCPPPVP